MSRERWARLSPLVDAALDLPAEERERYCNRIAADDPALGTELRRLIGRLGGRDGLLSAAALERFALLSEDEAAAPPAADLLQQVQTSLGTAYRLEREIGGGGMSRVFIADEPGLGRQVVIKVLKPELSAGINADRFAREIRLVASLQQANIVPLLSAGTAAGFPYYTMPLVEGRSLRERLAEGGALPIGEAVGVLRDVARALAFAHGRGVMHRDIKPGNVLLSGRTAVVTDFGIAKALGASRAAGDDAAITQAGGSLGTPAYMAPEQATGDPATDHRADLYAFGCMAYEIFTGAPPFQGSTVHRIIEAHLKEIPRPVTEKRADVPAPLAALIAQCLEKDPGRRPQTALEVLAVLDGETTLPAPPVRRPLRIAVVLVTVAVVATLITLIFARREPRDQLTLAAIPFTPLKRDTALEYRTVGISDEIMTGMAKVPGVHIIGRLAAYRYKDSIPAPDVRNIARSLGVRFLVTGTFDVRDGRVTVSAQLNDSTTRNELWADTFSPPDAEAIGPITDAIVRTIADTLRAHFGSRVGAVPRGASTRGTTNNAAYDQYQLGQNLVKQRGSGVRRSVENFEQAIKLDSNYAQAYAALATALQFYPFYVGVSHDSVKARMIGAANRAILLDSTLADPHAALGAVYAADGQWQAFEDEFRRALDLEPDNVAVLHAYARLLVVSGNVRKAIEQLRHARQLDRGSALVLSWLAYAFFLDGHVDSASAEFLQAARLDSTIGPVISLGSLFYLSQEQDSVARRLMTIAPPAIVMSNAPYVYARLGDTAKANALIHAMESSNPRPWFTDVARATVQLAGADSASALASLERAAANGPMWINYLPIADPAFDLVRQSPRFIRLVERARLDPQAFNRVPPRD
jgi:serine/threonine-protein kinase